MVVGTVGTIRQIKPTVLSTQTITLANGKLLTTYWKDHSVNQILQRINKSRQSGREKGRNNIKSISQNYASHPISHYNVVSPFSTPKNNMER